MMLSATVAVAGCATTSTARAAPAYVGSQAIADPNALVDYLQKLPPGTIVRVALSHGHSVRGSLVKTTDHSLFVQLKTGPPEPIAEVPLDDVVRVTPEQPGRNSVGRTIFAIAAGAAVLTLFIYIIYIALPRD